MPDDGTENGFRYRAFISYSHADKAWGDWLHRGLETYRVPRRLVGTITPSGEPVPARVYPIFRDREELPVSASLPDNINHALEQSRYLIVICSPRSAASRWVNEEIKTFKRLGRENRVLALIVAGEPNASEDGGKPGFRLEDECFPQALRYHWDGDGGLSGERTEPVAADARPDKDGKRHATLKLLAGLLQVDYDQLRQREHERRVRRLTALTSAALALLAVFAGLTVYSEVQRRRAEQATGIAREQRQNAEAQRRDADTQRQKAQEQEQEASQQRNAAQEANRQFKAQLHEASVSDLATAQDLLGKGSWRQGIAYLGRSLKYDPENRTAGIWLWSELVYGQGDRDRLPQYRLPYRGVVEVKGGVAYSPDGQRIVTACGDRTAQQWEARTGRPIGEPLRHESFVQGVAYSPDGQRFVTACGASRLPAGYAQQWEAGTGRPIGRQIGYRRVDSVAYSPDGQRIVIACPEFGLPGFAEQWDVSTSQPIGERLRYKTADQKPADRSAANPNGFYSAAYSPDGRRILTVCQDDTVRQWEAVTGKPIGEPLRNERDVRSAAYSPDGQRFIVCADKTVQQWETATGKPVGEPLHDENGIASAAYSPDGQRFVTTCKYGSPSYAQQWEASTGKPIGEPLRHEDMVEDAIYSPDGQHLVTVCDVGATPGYAQQWEATTRPAGGEPLRCDGGIGRAVYSPDGQRFVTVGTDGRAWQREAGTGRPLGAPMGDEHTVNHAAYSPDGRRIVIACGGYQKPNYAQQWDSATGKPIGELIRHESAVNSAAYSPDGRRIVTVGGDNTVRQWDAATGKPAGEPLRHREEVRSAAYSPDGQRIVTTAGDDAAHQWDANTGKEIGAPMRHNDVTPGAAYSPDGQRILTYSYDRTARQWEAATGNPIGTPLRHEHSVQSAAYSPDGQRIVTACGEFNKPGYAQQWETNTGKPIGAPMRQEDNVVSAVYTADGQHIVAVSGGAVWRWEAVSSMQPSPAWIDQLVQVASGYRFTESGDLLALAFTERLALREQLSHELTALPTAEPGPGWSTLARWFLTPTGERAFTPGSPLTTVALAERELVSGQEDGVRDALALCPALPLVHLALAASEKDAARADFLRRYGLARLPAGDVSRHLRAATMLRVQQQPRLALQTLEKLIADIPSAPTPDIHLLANVALTRWLCNDKEGAISDCLRLISAGAGDADAARISADAALSDADRATLLAVITETLRRHPEFTAKPGKLRSPTP